MLTHRHVEVFRALMIAGSVTRAAELLHTSQPPSVGNWRAWSTA